MARIPAVAGQFYPGTKTALLGELQGMIPEVQNKIKAIGAIAPHAGYVYSGSVAGHVYAKLTARATYIILSPNHTGCGDRFAACGESWYTPLGEVAVNTELLAAVMGNTDLVTEDPVAHMHEHSVEVQLPFIQRTAPNANIVPITVQHGNIPELREIASSIVSAVERTDSDAVIIASSDLTHYESREIAKKKDDIAIQSILDIDAEGLIKVIEKNDISMCGYIPSAIMLMCAEKVGAKKSELIKYSDSGYVTGDTGQVVGYAGMVVY